MFTDLNKKLVAYLALFHIAIIATANYAVQVPITFAGYSWTWATFVFPAVVVATDLTVRLFGRRNAYAIIALAYIPAIFISAGINDSGLRVGLASATAYLLSHMLDITVFQKIRERINLWWPAPLISTLIANCIDTYTFYAAAFYRSDSATAQLWPEIAATDLAFKTVVSIAILLPVYRILLNYLRGKVATEETAS